MTTSTADGDGDYFVVVDAANADKKLTKANILLSGFNNDLFLNEDDFATDSATKAPTQQSAKTYIATQVANLVASAPTSLDTLNELAASMNDDASFSATMNTALGLRVAVTEQTGFTSAQELQARKNIGALGTVTAGHGLSGGGTGSSSSDTITIALADPVALV